MIKLKLKKGDKVIVITGKDKGKEGEILKIFPKENKAIVSGINKVQRHTKPTQEREGGILQKELPIHISNIACIDPDTGRPTKVGLKILKDDDSKLRKVIRIAKKSGKILA